MSRDTFERGREDAHHGEHNPPGDSLGETLSSETNRFYEGKRDDYEAGHALGSREVEESKSK
jgi:hypothetical protein